MIFVIARAILGLKYTICRYFSIYAVTVTDMAVFYFQSFTKNCINDRKNYQPSLERRLILIRGSNVKQKNS